MFRSVSPSKAIMPAFEPLESRQLLSVSTPLLNSSAVRITPDQTSALPNVLGTYSGFVTVTASGGISIGVRPNAIMGISAETVGGSLTGVLNVAGFGPINVTGVVTNTRFSLASGFDPNRPGTSAVFVGTVASDGLTLSGTVFEFSATSSARGTLPMIKIKNLPTSTSSGTTTSTSGAPGTSTGQSTGAGAGGSTVFGGGTVGAGAGGLTSGSNLPPVPGTTQTFPTPVTLPVFPAATTSVATPAQSVLSVNGTSGTAGTGATATSNLFGTTPIAAPTFSTSGNLMTSTGGAASLPTTTPTTGTLLTTSTAPTTTLGTTSLFSTGNSAAASVSSSTLDTSLFGSSGGSLFAM